MPQGEIGEIYSRVADNPDFTYHNKPEKRAEIERDGFITSGDVGYIDEDGYVFICDRKRDMVISFFLQGAGATIRSIINGRGYGSPLSRRRPDRIALFLDLHRA